MYRELKSFYHLSTKPSMSALTTTNYIDTRKEKYVIDEKMKNVHVLERIIDEGRKKMYVSSSQLYIKKSII